MVGECLQCVKEPTNEEDKKNAAIVSISSHCKEEVVGHVQEKSL